MGFLVFFLLLVIAILSVMCWTFFSKMDEQTTEITQIRRQFDHYLSDDRRTFDRLWNRAQIETARVVSQRYE
jgi:hypothetical protein